MNEIAVCVDRIWLREVLGNELHYHGHLRLVSILNVLDLGFRVVEAIGQIDVVVRLHRELVHAVN